MAEREPDAQERDDAVEEPVDEDKAEGSTRDDAAEEAAEDTFPASDAPAW